MSNAIEKGGDRLPTVVRFVCYPDGKVHGSLDAWGDRRNPDQGMVTGDAIIRLVRTVMSACTPAECVTIEDILRAAETRAAARNAQTEGAAK